MTPINSINTASSGLQIQQQRLQQSVSEVASAENLTGTDSQVPNKALVEQIEITNNFQANSRMLQAASDRIGTLLDIKA